MCFFCPSNTLFLPSVTTAFLNNEAVWEVVFSQPLFVLKRKNSELTAIGSDFLKGLCRNHLFICVARYWLYHTVSYLLICLQCCRATGALALPKLRTWSHLGASWRLLSKSWRAQQTCYSLVYLSWWLVSLQQSTRREKKQVVLAPILTCPSKRQEPLMAQQVKFHCHHFGHSSGGGHREAHKSHISPLRAAVCLQCG